MSYIFTNGPSNEKHEILERLYSKYAKLMYYIAYEILNDKFLAEDAVHTVFLKLEKSKFRIDSISCNKTKSFMVIITRNIAISIYNAKKKNAIIYDYGEWKEIPDVAMLPIDVIINDESIQNIKDALSLLDNKYSDIILMKYFSEYTNSEIATLFNISEDLVSLRLHRGKKLLFKKLNEGKSNE